MVQLSSSSNPPEAHVAKHLLTGGLKPEDVEPDGLPEPDGLIEWMPPLPEPPPDPLACAQAVAERDLLKQRVAKLEAELENERRRVAELGRDNWNLHEALSVAEAEMQPTEVCPACNGDVPWGKPGICYLCGNMGVVTKERLLRIDVCKKGEAANKRVAELEAALAVERRAVEALARVLHWARTQMAIGDGVTIAAPDTDLQLAQLPANRYVNGGRYLVDVADWAAWARKQAREEAGGEPETERGK